MAREQDGGTILRGGSLGLLRSATTNTESECRQRHGIHIVGCFTWTVTLMAQFAGVCGVSSTSWTNGILLEMMSLCSQEGVWAVILKGKVKIIVQQSRMCCSH